MELKFGDIKLRKFKESDGARLVELANNENIARNLRDGFPHPYTINHARDFIERCISLHPPTVFAIEYQGEYVGNIGLVKGNDVYRKSAEVGYFIGEQYWNKGITTTALNLICEYGFTSLDVVRIHAGVYEHNVASQKVLEKCGFLKEGVFQKAVFKQEKYWNEVRYAKLIG
jgi:[ribosomal protein S5]-alanine N-acetyltransferase